MQVSCRGSRTTSDAMRRVPRRRRRRPCPSRSGTGQRGPGRRNRRECPCERSQVEPPRTHRTHAGPQTARSAHAAPSAGRVGSRMICRAVGRSMPAGTRACSPREQLIAVWLRWAVSQPATGRAGGSPWAPVPRSVPDYVCGLLSCNGLGWCSVSLLMSVGRVFWLVGGRAGCHVASCGQNRRICGESRVANAFAQVNGMSADVCKTVG
jgi:hypothetical protein